MLAGACLPAPLGPWRSGIPPPMLLPKKMSKKTELACGFGDARGLFERALAIRPAVHGGGTNSKHAGCDLLRGRDSNRGRQFTTKKRWRSECECLATMTRTWPRRTAIWAVYIGEWIAEFDQKWQPKASSLARRAGQFSLRKHHENIWHIIREDSTLI